LPSAISTPPRTATELELITAPEARDALTTTYRRHLANGDGPAFLALYAPEMDRVAERLDAARHPYRREGGFIDLDASDQLAYVFFGPRNHSPTDRPEHFAHANTAQSLVSVWLAVNPDSRERWLLDTLGAAIRNEDVFAPEAMRAAVAHLPEGDVRLLPVSRQLVPGRAIVGATLAVRDLETARHAIAQAPVAVPPIVRTADGASVFLPPTATHGLWLELHESRRRP
jgi:hypothetical protein